MYRYVTSSIRSCGLISSFQVTETKSFTSIIREVGRLAELLPSRGAKFDEKRPRALRWPPSSALADLGDPAVRALSRSGFLRDALFPAVRPPRSAPVSPVLGRLA